MRRYTIVSLPGDGIGPEVTAQAEAVLAAARRFGFEITFVPGLIGGAAVDETGAPLPDETIAACRASDAVLLGAVGGPRWDALPPESRPEKGILGIRAALGLFANLRPARIWPALRHASPLKDSVLGDGLDILMVRELTGGIYFGRRGRTGEGDRAAAFDTEEYSAPEIDRIARLAFGLAGQRRGGLCSVDKANVLATSRLWRERVSAMGADFPQVRLSHMYVDNAAMQLVRAPGQFDVVLTNNIFGDILSDQASQLTGSIGLLPSASLGAGSLGLYEPIHGSAPDIAGQGVANPLAAILSAAMLLRWSLGETAAAEAVEAAVGAVLADGARTADIAGPGEAVLSTGQMGERVLAALE